MLPQIQLNEIRNELEGHKKPLFFFHDDPDGLASFLLFYRFRGEGKGIVVKSYPELGAEFLRKVEEYEPDIVFVLDKPTISQDFIDGIKVKVVVIDHHPVAKKYYNCAYYNPRLNNPQDNSPVSNICYEVVKQDIWIAMVGIVGDWNFPDFLPEFRKKYPSLLPEGIKKPEEALYNCKLGELVRIFSFILKGKSSEVMSCVKILTRIKEPEEILEQRTSRGKYIFKRYDQINQQYQELLKTALRDSIKDKGFLRYIYINKNSFTSDLSNELIYKFPEKVILIGREKSGEVKCSIRSTKILLPSAIEKSLEGIDGYGGGHEHAGGVCVKKRDFERFLRKLRESLRS